MMTVVAQVQKLTIWESSCCQIFNTSTLVVPVVVVVVSYYCRKSQNHRMFVPGVQ